MKGIQIKGQVHCTSDSADDLLIITANQKEAFSILFDIHLMVLNITCSTETILKAKENSMFEWSTNSIKYFSLQISSSPDSSYSFNYVCPNLSPNR